MKDLYNIGFRVLLIISVCLMALFSGREIGVLQTEARYSDMIDSINAIASIAPDTIVIRDTIFPAPEIIYIKQNVPVPVPVNANTSFYNDSVVNDQLSIFIQDTIQGILISRKIGYALKVPLQLTETITVTEKVPVVIKESNPEKAALYTGMLLPYSESKIGIGLFLDMTRKSKIYGAQYQAIGDRGVFSVKFGFKF